ncbi:unnamed protein product [Ceutorhynchus assimilis]|uniref:Uncharacterized protein n=1 Tax=Ceutorhynchus assimilis TaxID=467358 RepID=A0A9N9MVF1_9CUCU|nr:unnamed protein product [Ceutorhynchus assimilis]
MRIKMKIFVLVCVVTCGFCETEQDENRGLHVFGRTINECLNANERYACFAEKVARALEKSMDWNIEIMDGVTLQRNNETVNHRQARLLGFSRLSQSIQNFFQTHVISLELGGARQLRRGEGGGGGGGLGFEGGMKALRKEKKYMSYAFMVLLGIFGLTGPLVMKVLALMAANALLAAKAALIIVGSVALKKLFERDHQEPAVKVHTIAHDEEDYDHDRISKYGYSGYAYDGTYNKNYPYSGYYDDYYKNNVAKNSNVNLR